MRARGEEFQERAHLLREEIHYGQLIGALLLTLPTTLAGGDLGLRLWDPSQEHRRPARELQELVLGPEYEGDRDPLGAGLAVIAGPAELVPKMLAVLLDEPEVLLR